LALFDHHTVTHDHITLFGINNDSPTAGEGHSILLQHLISGVVPFNAAADQTTGRSTQARVAVRQHSTANAAQYGSAGMPA